MNAITPSMIAATMPRVIASWIGCAASIRDRISPTWRFSKKSAGSRSRWHVFLGDRKLELRRFPDPTPGPRDVILAIKASGMCGSDLHTYRAPANPGGVVMGGIKRAAGVIAGHEP